MRGGSVNMHHDIEDIEDIVAVLDGRPSIVEDVREASTAVQEFLQDEFEALLLDQTFDDRLPWLLGGEDARKPVVLERTRQISGL